ncbi:MAG: transcriptional antiterminator RfaH [Acidobacteriota bacterium]|jgi:transcriptional antiterminator RfaH|nr:transcriptional antiterminator RfaH [Acidobacteriota bacterium]
MSLNPCQFDDEPRWYVIHTKPKQESRADYNLRAWQVETFFPLLKERSRGGRSTYVVKPLFSRYLFARFRASELLHKVYYTRGVQSVVNFGEHPCHVEDECIELMKSRRDQDGFVRLRDEFNAGDRVMICNGPLRNLLGIFEGDYRDAERVSILLAAVGYQSRVVIEREFLRKVS